MGTHAVEEQVVGIHKWSGWPGAFCLACGKDDPWEYAIGNGFFDPFGQRWNLEMVGAKESKEECEQDNREGCSKARSGKEKEA